MRARIVLVLTITDYQTEPEALSDGKEDAAMQAVVENLHHHALKHVPIGQLDHDIFICPNEPIGVGLAES